MSHPIRLIWAQAENGVIGADGGMPWHVPEDLAHFRELTLGDPVVMGRRTWDSLPERFRPLPGRVNIVVTRDRSWSAPGAEVTYSLEEALEWAQRTPGEATWVIGGADIFAQTIGLAERLEVTYIDGDFDGDAFAPVLGDEWAVAAADPDQEWHTSTKGFSYRFARYERASL
ncbi:dihydrofolate reductase [soil metagenome]